MNSSYCEKSLDQYSLIGFIISCGSVLTHVLNLVLFYCFGFKVKGSILKLKT